MTTTTKTDYRQLEQFLQQLPRAPILIPIRPNSKIPEVPAGESWKNPDYHLTPEQALNRLKTGQNVGVVAYDWLCIVDLDNPEKYTLEKPTLTVTTRSGALHKYYLNDGTIENSVGRNSLAKCGEVRAEWQYVLSPGSYVPPDPESTGIGVYHITQNMPLSLLCKQDLPEDFMPTEKTLIPINPEILNSTVPMRNHRGTSLDDFRKRDPKLNDLLNGLDLTGDTSRDDASTLNHLINDCEFSEAEAIAILKKYRYRPKLERPDYIQNTLNHITRRDPNPIYQLNLQNNQPIRPVQTNNNIKPQQHKQEKPLALHPADRIVKQIKQQTLTFLTDQYNNPYIHTKQTSNNQIFYATIPVNSREFKNYASYLLYQTEEKTIPNETITTVTNTINGICQHEGQKLYLYNRVAQHNSDIYLDLVNNTWQAIKITPDYWIIEDNPPILFRRYKHQKPLPNPSTPTTIEQARIDIQKIFNHLNITPENHLIFLTTIISYLIPNIPHPILIIHGPQGSAKSTIYRFIRRLIDPSHIELLTLPNGKDNETIQQLNHHWLTFYDNITYISDETSDIFCRAVTGAGFSKRELYTNDDDVIYNIKRCIGFNGINQVAKKGDLLDRAILVETQPIEQRKTESDINQAYEQDQPIILSAILTILSETLRIQPTIKIDNYQRLADFHHYGAAITQALGHTTNDFNQAYTNKIETQIDEVINNDPVAMVFLKYFDNYFTPDKQQYASTNIELLHLLTQTANEMQIPTKQKNIWPQDVIRLKCRLNGLKPALTKKGYTIEDVRSKNERKVFVYKTVQTHISTYTEQQNDKKGDADDADDTVFTNYIPQSNFENNIEIEGRVYENSVHSVHNVTPVLIPDSHQSIFSKSEISQVEEMRRNASFTPPTPPTEVCYFCGSGYVDGEVWLSGPVSFDNPAHLTCYRSEENKQKNEEKK